MKILNKSCASAEEVLAFVKIDLCTSECFVYFLIIYYLNSGKNSELVKVL